MTSILCFIITGDFDDSWNTFSTTEALKADQEITGLCSLSFSINCSWTWVNYLNSKIHSKLYSCYVVPSKLTVCLRKLSFRSTQNLLKVLYSLIDFSQDTLLQIKMRKIQQKIHVNMTGPLCHVCALLALWHFQFKDYKVNKWINNVLSMGFVKISSFQIRPWIEWLFS